MNCLKEIKKIVENFNYEDITIVYDSDFHKVKTFIKGILEIIDKTEKIQENLNTNNVNTNKNNEQYEKIKDEPKNDIQKEKNNIENIIQPKRLENTENKKQYVNLNVNKKDIFNSHDQNINDYNCKANDFPPKRLKKLDSQNDTPERLEILEKDIITDKPFIDKNLNVKSISEVDDLKVDKINEINKPDRLKITESNRILNKVKKDCYKYYDKYLPERKFINFDNFNSNTKCIHITKIKNVLEFYELFTKYKDSCIDKESSKSFYEYIDYNNAYFSMKYFSNFYDKVKKCYNFIKYFKEIKLNNEDIIKLLYKSNITYDKLYKIKGNDYEELKRFFTERIYFLNIKIPSGLVKNNKTEIKRNTKKESLLTYVGTKHNYTDVIKNHMNNINENTKIFDLFGGSLSIPYELKKIYPKNDIIVNDANEFLVNFYNELKTNYCLLFDELEKLNTNENIKNYNILLEIINNKESTNIEKAAVYYILNKISYNGRIFYNNGKISIHCYRKEKININKDKFLKFSKFLQNIKIDNMSLLEKEDHWFETIKENDILILDPPYDIMNVDNKHYLYNFNREQQEKLYKFINKCKNKNIKLIIFNGDTLFIRKLYKNFNQCIIESRTSMNLCKPYKELLLYN